ncbi:MAG: DUF349 domain-containing protein [Pedobacter sp.]|nr:DUF349 domain-containing protein [Pedobacter sp.]
MLKRLFSRAPKWQSPKSQKRIEALAELDLSQEKDAGILLKLAREDSEPAVRRAAVAFLTDVDVISQIQKRDLEAQVRDAATARLHDLLAGKVPALALPLRLAQLQRITAPQTLIHLIREADAMELRLAAIARLDDEIYLDDIARNSSIAKLRLAAAERISTPSLLEALAEATKQKDKNVYKALRTRLDEQNRSSREAQALQEKCESLCAAMEAHARSAMNPLYAAKAESLRQQWQELSASASAAATERFETALALALRQINEIQAAEQRRADEAQAREEVQQCVDTLEATLAEYQGQDDFDLPALTALSKTQRLRWELATQLQAAPEALARRQSRATEKLEQLAEMLLQWQQDRLMVEGSLARLEQIQAGAEAETAAEEKQALLQALNDVRSNYSAHGLPLPLLLQKIPGLENILPVAAEKPAAKTRPEKADKTEERKQLKTLLEAIASSVEAGNSRDASKKLRRAQELAREHHLHDAQLNELGERVRELKSWAGFAVQPKKEALLEKMRALITHEMEPDDKADAIHALQEEWKALGVADASVEQPLWEQFKALGDQAYEPCRAHFAAQRELREQNLKKRSELCEQLQSYADALPESPDWKKHEAIIRTARQEWQGYQPSDRQKTRPLQDRFNALLKALEDKHRDVQKKNEAAKLQLVQRAQKLQELEDTRSACDQAKALQQEWKAIGAGSYKADQRLWQEFRAASDTLFAKRDGEFKARQEARDALTQQAGELIQSMQQLAASADVKALGSEAARLEEAFQALELPRDKGDSLRRQFDAARKQLENAGREQASQARQRAQSEKVEQWMARSAETTDGIALQDEKAAQLLLDLEILLEIPAQPELQEARRARQMQRLQSQGLRKQSGEQTRLLLDDLLQTTPLSATALPGFAERLRVILTKA